MSIVHVRVQRIEVITCDVEVEDLDTAADEIQQMMDDKGFDDFLHSYPVNGVFSMHESENNVEDLWDVTANYVEEDAA